MENKTSKYFKYAIGEIVLVMIGILLALQVNNWNENRKSTKNETKLLNELYNDAILDSVFFESRNSSLEKHLVTVNRLNNIHLGINVDSVSKLSLDYEFIFDPSLAYQSTVEANFNSRIDAISNEEIKANLRAYSLAYHYLKLHYERRNRIFEINCNDLSVKYHSYRNKINASTTFGEYFLGIEFAKHEKVINYTNEAVMLSKERTQNFITINTMLLNKLRIALDHTNND
jgi:hypothetical protein